jgi:hypothetical protein
LVGLFLLLCAAAFVALKEALPRQSVLVGSYVRNDDFVFRVLRARRESGPDERHYRYIIDVECENRAVRVPFMFKPDMVAATFMPSAPRKLPPAADSWKEPVELKPSESCRRRVVFVGPKLPTLQVWFQISGDSGDFMDAIFGERYEVTVPFER